MKLKRIILLVSLVLSLVDLNSQIIKTFSITTGVGIPIGKTNYIQNKIFDAALFSNYSTEINAGFEITFKTTEAYAFGVFSKWNKYKAWNAKNISTRFDKSSLSTFDLGPMLYIYMKHHTLNNQYERLIIAPHVSLMKLHTNEDAYTSYSVETINNNQSLPLTFQKKETSSQLKQLLPGIYIGYEWSLFINELSAVFIRPGIIYMFTKSGDYPDKYVIIPSLTAGYTFGYSKNKWFFIKNIK